ncbi:hypothetical protein B0H15DRAFT_449920 [Mycena belliarum]|uniref:Uncharacterized protein n=1 Tax=Mycena belliarum TaxID=1033014 RepID=A0AAD6TWL5_9AGAR|nr:hypothetical protein B0H15DRAFT_449920 [Mycena belliae]
MDRRNLTHIGPDLRHSPPPALQRPLAVVRVRARPAGRREDAMWPGVSRLPLNNQTLNKGWWLLSLETPRKPKNRTRKWSKFELKNPEFRITSWWSFAGPATVPQASGLRDYFRHLGQSTSSETLSPLMPFDKAHGLGIAAEPGQSYNKVRHELQDCCSVCSKKTRAERLLHIIHSFFCLALPIHLALPLLV